jgi:hypothetical protein
VDLETDRWPDALRATGFDASIAAVLVAEVLSYYLTEEENALLLDHLASLGGQGSRLGLDMLSRDYLDNPAVAPLFSRPGASHGSSGPMKPASSSRLMAGPPMSRISMLSAEGSADGLLPVSQRT